MGITIILIIDYSLSDVCFLLISFNAYIFKMLSDFTFCLFLKSAYDFYWTLYPFPYVWSTIFDPINRFLSYFGFIFVVT